MIKFGTGGWRAIIADGFTKENIRLLTARIFIPVLIVAFTNEINVFRG